MAHNLLIFLSACLMLMSACDRRSGSGDFFNTTDSGELFFHNLRKSEYLIEENKAARLRIYSHKDQQDTSLIAIKLIHNWREDKAYLMLSIDSMDDEIPFLTPSDTIVFTGQNIQNHFDCAHFLYRAHMNEQPVLVKNDSLNIHESFIMTMKDFLQLVSKK